MSAAALDRTAARSKAQSTASSTHLRQLEEVSPVQPINPDAFETELDERRRVMQQDVRTPRPAMRTRVLVVMLLAALAAVVGAASFDARRARGHVEDAAAWDRAAAEAGLQSDTSWPPRLGAVLVAAHLGQLQRQRW